MKCLKCGVSNPEIKIAGKNVPSLVCNHCGALSEQSVKEIYAEIPEKLVLICNAFSPIFLREKTEYTLGRERANTITIVDNLTSRYHACITVDSNENVFIEDLHSSNGTFVNGQKIRQKKQLALDDKIEIGTHILFLKRLSLDQAEQSIPKKEQETLRIKDLSSPVVTPEGMFGSLAHINMYEVLSTLDHNTKTGILTVEYEELQGKMFLYRGKIVRCEFGNVTGIDAVYELLRFHHGIFEFVVSSVPESIPDEIPMKTVQILLEFARNYDEKIGTSTTTRHPAKRQNPPS